MFQPLHFTGVRVIPLQQDDGHTELQVEVILQPEGGGTSGRWMPVAAAWASLQGM